MPELSLNAWIRVAAGVAVVLASLVHEAEWFQYRIVQQMELFAYDARLRLFMPRTLDPRVVILDIDEKSLNAEGRWPWSRNKLAIMVKQLFEHYKVRVVGFDMAFAEADPSSGLASLEALGKGERKDDAEYQAWLEKARPTLDYDRIGPACCRCRRSTRSRSASRAGSSATTSPPDTAATSSSCRSRPRRPGTSTRLSTSTA
jgi:adenylate cyclase